MVSLAGDLAAERGQDLGGDQRLFRAGGSARSTGGDKGAAMVAAAGGLNTGRLRQLPIS